VLIDEILAVTSVPVVLGVRKRVQKACVLNCDVGLEELRPKRSYIT
jgi:hypothetical protein